MHVYWQFICVVQRKCCNLGMLQALRMDRGPLCYENDPPPLHMLATGLNYTNLMFDPTKFV